MEFPALFAASSVRPPPIAMLINEQQPSPIMTAIANATTVSGNTTVFAALPYEPSSGVFAMNSWSTIL